MCDVERYIDNYEEQMAMREVFKLTNELHEMCEKEDNAYKNHVNDQITHECCKNGFYNPCGCGSSDSIKETFYDILDQKRNDFLDEFDDLSACEKALIYKYTEYLKR